MTGLTILKIGTRSISQLMHQDLKISQQDKIQIMNFILPFIINDIVFCSIFIRNVVVQIGFK